MTVAKYTNIV